MVTFRFHIDQPSIPQEGTIDNLIQPISYHGVSLFLHVNIEGYFVGEMFHNCIKPVLLSPVAHEIVEEIVETNNNTFIYNQTDSIPINTLNNQLRVMDKQICREESEEEHNDKHQNLCINILNIVLRAFMDVGLQGFLLIIVSTIIVINIKQESAVSKYLYYVKKQNKEDENYNELHVAVVNDADENIQHHNEERRPYTPGLAFCHGLVTMILFILILVYIIRVHAPVDEYSPKNMRLHQESSPAILIKAMKQNFSTYENSNINLGLKLNLGLNLELYVFEYKNQEVVHHCFIPMIAEYNSSKVLTDSWTFGVQRIKRDNIVTAVRMIDGTFILLDQHPCQIVEFEEYSSKLEVFLWAMEFLYLFIGTCASTVLIQYKLRVSEQEIKKEKKATEEEAMQRKEEEEEEEEEQKNEEEGKPGEEQSTENENKLFVESESSICNSTDYV